jgi:hypothetical protein
MHESSGQKEMWEKFCAYFNNTWLNSYEINTWNIHHVLETDYTEQILINRTNNPLESYNRYFKETFSNCGHPSMKDFVTTLQGQCEIKAQDYNDTIKNKKKKTERSQPKIPSIPADYEIFKRGKTTSFYTAHTSFHSIQEAKKTRNHDI